MNKGLCEINRNGDTENNINKRYKKIAKSLQRDLKKGRITNLKEEITPDKYIFTWGLYGEISK